MQSLRRQQCQKRPVTVDLLDGQIRVTRQADLIRQLQQIGETRRHGQRPERDREQSNDVQHVITALC
jgi:hypothetical protein